jgi:putative PIG3 family NAD(P)H quinone oxidoreductase
VRALTITDRKLVIDERPTPNPTGDDVRVRVHGAGLNRADLVQRAGAYPAPPGVPADIPGLEFAGTVDALGADATGLTVGDRVFGIVAGGAQAEYVIVPASHCARVPDALDLTAMGGVPEAFITAHDALVTQAHMREGDWVLIHAVGSGVGTSALQLSKALGARVVGTARTEGKLDRCRDLGLDIGIVPTTDEHGALDADALAWAIVEATGAGADVTLDLVGGDYLAADVNAAAPKGRIVCVSAMAGGQATVPIISMMSKRLTVMGTMLRPRDRVEKAAATTAFATDVLPLLERGTVAPIIERIVPLEDANDAYELLASDSTFGKLVLDCS